MSEISSRVRRCSHRYGIEVPTSIASAKEIDEKNGNEFWEKAIKKEMTNIGIAFSIFSEGEKATIGWIKAISHLVFDVKMDFTRKARWVKDGHCTRDPTTLACAAVVSR